MKNLYLITCLFLFTMGLQAQDFKFGKVSLEEVLETGHPEEKEANAAVLYRYLNSYYSYSTGSGLTLITEVHERIKIYNKDGFDWATREVSYYKNGKTAEALSGLKGYTYNVVNGKLVEEKLKKEGIFKDENSKYSLSTKFTMPSVTEGSVIEYQYTIRSPFVTAIDDVLLQYTIPINRLEVNVKIPEFFGFVKHLNPRSQLNFSIEEERSSFNYSTAVNTSQGVNLPKFTQTGYKIERNGIPALKEEPHIDYISNYAAFLKWELQFTRFPESPIENLAQTWEGVTKSIYTDGGYAEELNRTRYFEKDLDALLAGTTGQIEKAQIIFGFLKSKVTWNKYLGFLAENGGSKAYKEGEGNVGDINLLLTAMLKYAGLNAHPVLLSTKNNGVPLFPTRQGFNYVVAGLETAEGIILLDATDPYAAFGELPARARNWNGRIIRDKENSDWVNLMPTDQSKNSLTLNVQISPDSGMKGKLKNVMNGFYARSYRENYVNLNPEDHLQILAKNKGEIQINELKTENEKLPGTDIVQSYDFELQNGIEIINDRFYLKPMLFLAEKENPFKADVRVYPIIMDFPVLETKTINLIIPEGYEVESIPESVIVKLKEDSGTFKFITLQNGNFIRVICELDLKDIVYTPLDFVALKDFYAQMVEKHSEAIVLKRI